MFVGGTAAQYFHFLHAEGTTYARTCSAGSSDFYGTLPSQIATRGKGTKVVAVGGWHHHVENGFPQSAAHFTRCIETVGAFGVWMRQPINACCALPASIGEGRSTLAVWRNTIWKG